MALTFTRVSDTQDYWGATPVSGWTIALDNNYPTGGYAITAANVGLRLLFSVLCVGVAGTLANSASLLYYWDYTNGKLLVFYPSGGSTAPGALGAQSATATPAAGATPVTSTSAQPAIPVTFTAGQGLQVAAATDLSSITLRCLIFGQR